MIHTTTSDIPNKEIVEVLGIARGTSIRAKHVGKDIVAALRNLVGGEIKEYREALTETRELALARMLADAKEMKADAVVNVRFETSQVMQGAAELLAYGTAVKLR